MSVSQNILSSAAESPLLKAVKKVPPIWWYLGLLAVGLLMPMVSNDQFLFRILTMVMIWSILAIGQNIITGFCGQMSFGQAAFYGIGAYTSVLLTMHFGVPYPVALLASAAMAGLFGVLIGYPAMRIGGDYLFLVTIGFAEIMRLIFLNWDAVTGGAVGIPNVPPIELFGYVLFTNKDYYLLSLVLLAISVFISTRIVNSDIGRAFKAIREDEVAARAVGIDVARYKLMSFGIGAAFGGVAGSVVAHFLAYVGPDMFTNWESTLVFVIVLIGGLGSIPGTLLGAVVLIGAFEFARSLIDYRLYIAGVLLLGTVLIRPSGLLGSVKLRTPKLPAAEPAEKDSQTATSTTTSKA
jgi:branched-chain amino acid transport system permease protein